jgi:hypothetical protein
MALTLPKTWVSREKLTSTALNAQFVAIQSFINTYCLLSTDAVSANTASKVVKRDTNGDFSARRITAVGTDSSSGFVGDLEGTADLATNIKGGGSSQIPYQSAEDTTDFVEAGTSGHLLQSQGAGNSPNWINATNSNLVNTIVKRDNSGNFSANEITADLKGNVTGNVTGDVTGDVIGNVTGDVSGKSLSTDALTDTGISAQFQSSLGAGGYQYLPNGFIFQWGVASTTGTACNFPKTFPNACVGVFLQKQNVYTEINPMINAYSKSSFIYYCYGTSGHQDSSQVFYMALGY